MKENLYLSDTHVGAEVRHAKVESPPPLLLLRCECARCRSCVREQGQREAEDATGRGGMDVETGSMHVQQDVLTGRSRCGGILCARHAPLAGSVRPYLRAAPRVPCSH